MVKAVVGANWGDEGKGKITDMLAQEADIIVRFQGGANAGHTIVNDYGKFALHTLPSGVFYNHTTSVIGNGVALNIPVFFKEYNEVIEKHMMAELPFMATENIMMDAVKAGGDRQELHERIRELSMEAGKTVKVEGKDNNLLELIAADPAFNLTIEELNKSMEPSRYVGRAKEQTTAFITKVVQPVLDEHKEMLGIKAEINV